MKILLIAVSLIVAVVLFFSIMNMAFYSKFQSITGKIRAEAGSWDGPIITEADLENLPPSVSRYIAASGQVGRKKISFVRIWHSGTFKFKKDMDFVQAKGEYFLSTKKPSFIWLGKISPFPLLSFSALDSYFNGKGQMVVKVLSAIKVVDEEGEIINSSAFGRCVAEMTMSPSFFLDQERIKWTKSDSCSAECVITDSGLSTNARLFFKPDGSLDKIIVDRYYDRGNGQGTLEKFVGAGTEVKDFNGLKMNTVYDGTWILPEGDLHYVHFIVDKVEYE